MIEVLRAVLPYISGLWTLPWILVGFIVTIILSRFIDESKIDRVMKKIGLILLFFFVPVLLFRVFLNVNFGAKEVEFMIVVLAILLFMYILAYAFARYKAKKLGLKGVSKNVFIKTILTNQGRSAAFVGGAMLAIEAWRVPAAIYISLVGIALFAAIPYILSRMHKKESKNEDLDKISALPWYLKIYPWYLISFVIAATLIHGVTGLTTKDLGDTGVILTFYTAITIPAALYYVGSSIHPHDLKLNEMKKLFSLKPIKEDKAHWLLIRNIFFMTMILTPAIILALFSIFLVLNMIPKEWFAVIILNAILPITSTNMFLVPYGIDKKATALSITWTTIVSVPLLVVLINIFAYFFV
jgi:hypothetical protein